MNTCIKCGVPIGDNSAMCMACEDAMLARVKAMSLDFRKMLDLTIAVGDAVGEDTDDLKVMKED